MKTREEEIKKASLEFRNNTKECGDTIVTLADRQIAFQYGAKWADEHPSVETMLKLFWFFDKHGLIADDLCFDPRHFMKTVAKEHFGDFDMEKYCKTRK